MPTKLIHAIKSVYKDIKGRTQINESETHIFKIKFVWTKTGSQLKSTAIYHFEELQKSVSQKTLVTGI